jgi:RimJ/RimL family protein N-acetyltransferase
MFGPVLRGEKVTLRPPEETDPPRFVEWLSDVEVTRFLGNRHRALALFQEEDWFKKVGESRNDVVWIVEAEGRAIGSTGIQQIDWRNAHGVTGILIGDKAAWRKGYATEAIRLRTEYAFLQLNFHKLSSETYRENEPIRRALAHSGYREVGIAREHQFSEGRWHDLWVCEVLRADWDRAHSRA